MTHERSSRPENPGAATTATPIADTDSNRRADLELDLALLGGPAADVWVQLFEGRFRLAVPCERCGRWLTAGASKAHRMGAHCRAKVAAEAVPE